MTNANDFLMGGGTTSAKWNFIGETISGPITRQPEVRQQTDFKTKAPKTFPNGDPMNQLVVTLQTNDRDPSDSQDDGTRAVYIKGKQMTAAVRDAVRLTGAPGLEVGGLLTLTWVSGGPRFVNDPEPEPKVFTAQYQRGANPAAAAYLNGGGQPATQQAYQQAPAAYAPPAAQPAYAAPQGYAPPPQQAYAAAPAPAQQPAYQPPLQQGPPRPPSVPEATWAGMDPNQQAAVAAAWATSPANTQPPF
jgi:hypothetical protein